MTVTKQDDRRHFGEWRVPGARMEAQPSSSRIAFVRIPKFSAQHEYFFATRMRVIVGLRARVKLDQADVLPAAR
jgi:hypothetical protein